MAALATKTAKMELMEWCQANPAPNGSAPSFRTEGNGQIPTLFTTVLTMPDGRVYESGKFGRKKESVHDTARKALADIKKGEGSSSTLSSKKENTSPEEGLRRIERRLQEIFLDEHGPRAGSLRLHMAIAAANNEAVPFSALVALDNKLANACGAYKSGAEVDHGMAVALVKEVGSRLCPMITLTEDGLGAKRAMPYSAEIRQFFSNVLESYRKVQQTGQGVGGGANASDPLRESEGVVCCSDQSAAISQVQSGIGVGSGSSNGSEEGGGTDRGPATFEAVLIPCFDQWDVESIEVVVQVQDQEYYLDVLARELGCDSSHQVLVSRNVGKSSLNMRLYTALPVLPSVHNKKGPTDEEEVKREVIDCVSMGNGESEAEDTKFAEGGGGMLCKNVRASWLSGYNVYGDAILAGVGHAWESSEVWGWRWTHLTIKDYHKLMMSRNPRGMYKLSRGAVVACELPSSFTSPLSWRGKLPKQMLQEYCQQRANLTKGQPCPVYKFYVIDGDGHAVPWKEGGEADDNEGATTCKDPKHALQEDDRRQEMRASKHLQKEDEGRKALGESTVSNISQGRMVRLGIDVRSPGAENYGKPDERSDIGLSPGKTQKGQYICHVKLPSELGGFECLSPRPFKSQSAASHSAALGALHRIQRVFDLRALNPGVDDDFPPYGGSYPWEEGYSEPEEDDYNVKGRAASGSTTSTTLLAPAPSISRNQGGGKRSLSLDMNAIEQSRLASSFVGDEQPEKRLDVSGGIGIPAAHKEAAPGLMLPEKEVIDEGEGDSVPSMGAMVCIDYTMHELVCDMPLEREWEDGWERVVYGSSTEKELLEENSNFEFELGSGAVIRPLDACVSTMRKGEVCRFRMELSEYWVPENPNAERKQQFMEKQSVLGRLSSISRQNSLGRVGSLGRQNSIGLQIPLARQNSIGLPIPLARQNSMGRGTPRRRGKKMVECRVKLVSVTEPEEEKMEGALFSPPLSKQRIDFVLRLLSAIDVKSMVDLGCGSGSLLEAVIGSPSLKRLAGIDVSVKGLQRAAKVLRTKVADTVTSGCRTSPVVESIVLYEGSITEPDARLRGFDLATCIEVVEHMDEEYLVKVGDSVLGGLMPRVLIVSTPNIEFNPLLFAETERKGTAAAAGGGEGSGRNGVQRPLVLEDRNISSAGSGMVVSSSLCVVPSPKEDCTGTTSGAGVDQVDREVCDSSQGATRRTHEMASHGMARGNRVVGGLGEALRISTASHSSMEQRHTSAQSIPLQKKNGVVSKRDSGENWSTVKLRNGDHRFEWTRAEFREWAAPLAAKHGYTVWFDGVGLLNGSSSPGDEGFASQIAIFVRGVEPSLVSGNVGVTKAAGGIGDVEGVVGSWGGLSSVCSSLGQRRAEDCSDTEAVGSWGAAGSFSGSTDGSSWEGIVAGPASWSGTGTAMCGSWGTTTESGSWGVRTGCGSWNGNDRELVLPGCEKKSCHPNKVFWQWP